MMAHRAEDFSDEDDHYLQLKDKGHDYEVKFNSPANSDLSGEGSEKQITLEPDEEVVFDITPYYMPASQTLNLSRTGIRSLPKSIFGLVGLKRLDLRYCHDFVELPPGDLEQLEVLDLGGTGIRDLPENLRCPMLLELYLHRNHKLRTIPPSFFNYMRALQTLNLSHTNISSLPKSIVKLVSLKGLILSDCKDFVELPPEVGELKQLEVLDLQGTKIRDLPENLRCPMLLELYLHKNPNLRTIPPSFFDYMPALQILNLSHTKIRSLPKSIVKLVSLKRLILCYGEDFMMFPPEVGELEQLEVLHLEGIQIINLPENLRCPMLLELDFHRSPKFMRIPPSFFDYMPALQILNLSHTNIWSLPKSIVKLVSLKRLILSYCYFIRELQPGVGELEQLEVLHLERNNIRDLPENLRCPKLLELYLEYNNKLSTIPPSFFNYMRALQTLNLSHTSIRSLPTSIVKLVSLKRLDLSYCKYFVELQPGVGELKQLQVLHLEGTKIRDLPENLRCPMLLELHLHRNPILRRIPPSFFDYIPALQILDVSQTNISSLPKSIVKLVSLKRLILSYRLLSKGGELKQLKVLELEGSMITDLHERVIDLEGKDIMHLPAEKPSHCRYVAVFLHNNLKLKTIPTSFFNYMPFLEVLNLSRTSIRSLPESIFTLKSLKVLILSYCHRFLRLSPEVGKLKRLEVLDLEGTEIMDLPKEIKELNKLTYLNLSFYGYMGDGSCSVMESDAVFPRGVIKALFRLEVLMISVNPDDNWWNECVEDIVTEVCNLKWLKTLVFYFPMVELVRYVLRNKRSWELLQSHFRFIVGHHVKRIMSRRPHGVELELERWERCLDYINGDKAIPEEIKTLLQYSTAFFLEQHATVKKLSNFGIENMKQLKCCVVGECNEVEVIIDETDAHEEDVVLGSLEYLCIYYMKNLRRIWEGPVQPKCLSLLKFLTLRTCPQLTTIFTTGLLDNLYNLEELTIDDCPSIKTLVSCEDPTEHETSHFLPNLKRISLHYMPGLVSISSGLHIAPRLELLSFYNCPNLKNLLIEEVSSKDLKKIEGETSWWEALKSSNDHPSYLNNFFVPINIEAIAECLSFSPNESLPQAFGEEGIEKPITSESQGVALELLQPNSNEIQHIGIEPETSDMDWKTLPMGLEISSDTIIQCEVVQSCLMWGGLGLTEPPKDEDWKNAKKIYLMDNELSDLPKNPRSPELSTLFLQRNCKLRTIPSSFFDHMPALQILNLSRTGIKSLPESIIRLVSLKRLFLNDCHRFMILSPKVGELEQLEVLDLEGTDIMDLPKEIKELTNLTCLEVSFCAYLSNGRRAMQSDVVVPCGIISALSHLEELNMSVNPDDKRWSACVEAIVTEVCTLQRLNTLKFYFPRVEHVRHFLLNSPMWVHPSLSNFRFTIGHHVKRAMSRLPHDVEFELEQWERCLKYINGVAIPTEIKEVLQYSTTFFLERHATIKNLSDFGIGNMKQLKCCVVGECNEVGVIIDETDAHEEDTSEEDSEADAHEEDSEVDACEEDDRNEIVSKTSGAKTIALGSLEYLYIYYMKNLRRIWKGPVQPKCLSLLKSLTLRTCPQLTTIFTTDLLDNLYNLEELTVEDCPSIKTLVSCKISAEPKTSDFLPNLKRISLHYMPGLISISSGLHIAPRLEWLSFYNCPNLKHLLIEEVSSKDLKKIKGEWNWWVALKWRSGRPSYLDDIFVSINI